jgi:hypothetical protein
MKSTGWRIILLCTVQQSWLTPPLLIGGIVSLNELQKKNRKQIISYAPESDRSLLNFLNACSVQRCTLGSQGDRPIRPSPSQFPLWLTESTAAVSSLLQCLYARLVIRYGPAFRLVFYSQFLSSSRRRPAIQGKVDRDSQLLGEPPCRLLRHR